MFASIAHDDVYRIETPRLWLRWPLKSDCAAIADYARHESVAGMTASIPHPYPDHQAEEFVDVARQANATGQSLDLLIVRKGVKQSVIGTVLARFPARQATDGPDLTPVVEPMIGYALHPDHWGHGYAHEAACAMIDAVFTLTAATGALATVRADNPASARIIDRLGFEQMGERMSHPPLRKAPALVRDYRLDRATWQDLSGAPVIPLSWLRPYDWSEWAGAA